MYNIDNLNTKKRVSDSKSFTRTFKIRPKVTTITNRRFTHSLIFVSRVYHESNPKGKEITEKVISFFDVRYI